MGIQKNAKEIDKVDVHNASKDMFDFDSSGLRKSKYYMTPNEEKELSSISGVELNPQLSNIYRAGIYARDSDIRNVIRYNDISKGHSNNQFSNLMRKIQDWNQSERSSNQN